MEWAEPPPTAYKASSWQCSGWEKYCTCFKHPNMWKRLILWPCPWCVDVCHKNDTLSQMSGRAWCHGKARHRMAKYGTAMAWHSMAALPTNTNTILPPAQTSLTRLHSLFQFSSRFFVPCIANLDELRNDMCLIVLRVSSGFLLLSSQRSAKITSKWPRLPSSKLEPRFRRRYGQSEQWLSCVAGRPGLWLWRSQWCTYSLETRTMKHC